MKLLYVVPSIGLVSETFVSDLLHGLVGRVPSLNVLCGECKSEEFGTELGLLVRQAPFLALARVSDRIRTRLRREPKWAAYPTLYDLQVRRILTPLLAELRPDIIFLEFGTTLARCAPPLTESGIPYVAQLHGHDVTGALAEPGYRDALARGLASAARVIVSSKHMARLAVLAGAPETRIRIIRHGIETEDIAPIPWSRRRADPPSAVFLGRMVPKKNPVALIEAFQRILAKRPEARLHMIGDGPERAGAMARAKSHGIEDAVIFHGELPRAAALEIVRQRWVYAQHSVTSYDGDQEGFGLSLAEAAVLTLPVVATRHNGIPEQVIDGKTGFLVAEYAFEEMADRMLLLFANADLCERLGEAGRRRAMSLYSPKRRLEETVATLNEVLSERTSHRYGIMQGAATSYRAAAKANM